MGPGGGRLVLTDPVATPTVPRVKWFAAMFLIGASAVGALSLWRVGEPSRAFDFSTFYAAGMLATTENAPAVFDRMPEDLSRTPPNGALARAAADAGYPAVPGQYFNLPVVMLLYRPLTWFDFTSAYRVTVAVNIAALVMLAWFIANATASSVRETAGEIRATPAVVLTIAAATLLCVACVSHPVRYNIQMGNVSVLLALAVVAAYVLDVRGRGVIGGVILGVAIIVKPAPALLLLYFVLRRRWAVTITTTATVLVMLGASVAYYGPEMHARWLEIVRWNGSHTFVAWNNQSLLAALLRFTVPPFEIAAWDVHAAPPWVVWTQRSLLVVAVASWCAVVVRRRRAPRDDDAFAAGTVLMTVALPFAWTHYFVVLLWPTAIIAARLLAGDRRDKLLDWMSIAVILVAWMAGPLATFELTQRWRTIPLVGGAAPRLLVSHVLAVAIVLFIALLRRPTPGRATPAPPGTPAT